MPFDGTSLIDRLEIYSMASKSKKKVYVGLSGGVDSSVSALLLKEAGYDVTGVFIDIWQPEFIECTSAEDKRDAMRVCSQIGIPFKVFEAGEEYKRSVVDYMVEEYRIGRTPNPDILCNRDIKFGLFFDWALNEGADTVATGHYARVCNLKSDDGSSKNYLLKGADINKDQSYFLWAVSADVFDRVVFPIGDMEKPSVRVLAEKTGLPTAKKKDSQGVCFLGQINIRDFLSRYIPKERGEVRNENGDVIGFHDGAWFYTIGQRHGFTVEKKGPDTGPFFVVAKSVKENILTVSNRPSTHNINRVSLSGENWIPAEANLESLDGLECMVRYRQKPIACDLSVNRYGTTVIFKEPQFSLAQGQSLVVYSGERCLGGGIIDKISQ